MIDWRAASPKFGTIGESTFADLFAILRRHSGNIKGEALLESILKQSCYVKEQLFEEKARNQRLQVYLPVRRHSGQHACSYAQAELDDASIQLDTTKNEKEQRGNRAKTLSEELEKEQEDRCQLQQELRLKCNENAELVSTLQQKDKETQEIRQSHRVDGHKHVCEVSMRVSLRCAFDVRL